jgi:hypothetical protein
MNDLELKIRLETPIEEFPLSFDQKCNADNSPTDGPYDDAQPKCMNFTVDLEV